MRERRNRRECGQGFSPDIRHEGVGSNTLLKMVASGLGITILPASIGATPDAHVKAIPLPFIQEKADLVAVYIAHRLSAVLQELIREVQ